MIRLTSLNLSDPIFLSEDIDIIQISSTFNGTEIIYISKKTPFGRQQEIAVAESPDEVNNLFASKTSKENFNTNADANILFCETDDEWYYKLSVKDIVMPEDRMCLDKKFRQMVKNGPFKENYLGKKIGEMDSTYFNWFYRKIPQENLDKFLTKEQLELYNLIHS